MLVGSLIVMVMFSGYENFVSKLDIDADTEKLGWLGKLDANSLKLKVASSIVAISSIQVLKTFMHVKDMSDRDLMWMVAIHITFILSGVLLANMDLLVKKAHAH